MSRFNHFIVNSWYAPQINRDSLIEYKNCGFNYIFFNGRNVERLNNEQFDEALQLCDELDLKVFVSLTDEVKNAAEIADKYIVHKSFAGFNYDEPVIFDNKINHREGLAEISAYVKKLVEKYPKVEFLVNLNPLTSMCIDWGTPAFTYEEYIDAQLKYINNVYADCDCINWLSCDDYPLCYKIDLEKQFFLKEEWLKNLEYLSVAKRDGSLQLKTNFFIQSMPYGSDANGRNRQPVYEDITLQLYALLAFGYDSVSYFCYCTPELGWEFNESQLAIIDRLGKRTALYEAVKAANAEIASFSDEYMLFNGYWKGVMQIIGKNNKSGKNTTFSMLKPLSVAEIQVVNEISSSEDLIVGYMKNAEDKTAFMAVNYNDIHYAVNSSLVINFKKPENITYYLNGKKHKVRNKKSFEIELPVGKGVFIVLE